MAGAGHVATPDRGARRAVLGARLDGHEQESLRRAPAREAGALHHRDDHRPGRRLRHRRPPRAARGREAERDRDPQGDGGERGQHRGDLPRGGHGDLRGGDGRGECPRPAPDLGAEHLSDHPSRRRRLSDQLSTHEAHGHRLRPGGRRHPRDLLPRHAVARSAGSPARPGRGPAL